MSQATPCVATLVSTPERAALTSDLLREAAATLPGAGAPEWLSAEEAVDLPFALPAGSPLAGVEAALRQALGDTPVDMFVQPTAMRRRSLFVADMDSTMIGQECLDELADFVGMKAHVAAITERAMRGEIAFEPALRERVALLKGLPVAVVDTVLAQRITYTPGGRELVATMRAHGGYTALVSGGFTLFTGPVAAVIGFDEHHGNRLEAADAAFSGTVAEPILGREAKLATLIRLRESRGLAPWQTIAIGDGANDLAMLGEAGLGVAFHAKPAVAAAAHARIEHTDLTALLYAQGYRRDAFLS